MTDKDRRDRIWGWVIGLTCLAGIAVIYYFVNYG